MNKAISNIVRLLVGSKTYDALQKRCQERRFRKICCRVRENGPLLLTKFDKICEDMGINYSIMYGTLLGSYREKGFIKDDGDIDIAISSKNITIQLIDKMVQSGFQFIDALVANNYSALHVAFSCMGVKFDLYSYDLDDTENRLIGFAPRGVNGAYVYEDGLTKAQIKRVSIPYIGCHRVDFAGIKVNAFANEDAVLRILYGEDYMIPKRGVKSQPNDYIWIEPFEKLYVYQIDYNQLRELKNKSLV